MTDPVKVVDGSKDRKYFTITPQIVWAFCRSPYDYTLWNVIKMIAGDEGECILSTPDLAVLAMMSAGKLVDCRNHLLEKGLLEGEIVRDPGYPKSVWHLRVPDLWPRNMAFRRNIGHSLRERIAFKRQQKADAKIVHLVKDVGDRSPGERCTTPGERCTTPGETKKNHKEEPKEEIWEKALSELELQMTRATFDTWLKTSTCIGRADHTITIQVSNQHAKEWLERRLYQIITRTVSRIVGELMSVQFTVRPQ